jgi:protein-disulfide isomerase
MAEKENKEEHNEEKQEDKKLFTITTQNIWKITTVVLAIIVVLLLVQNAKYKNEAQGETVPQTEETDEADAVDMALYYDDVVKGSDDAPVTVIIYSDPSCPYCAAAAGGEKMVAYMNQRSPGYEPAVPGIMENYVETGKVKLVFRYFPGHGKGVEAMKMLLCADEQDTFWELHDIFFDNQDLMEAGDTEGLAALARDVVPDTAAFDSCVETNTYQTKMDADYKRGIAAATSAQTQMGTPAFVINGKLITGAQPYSTFASVIDAALAE